MRRNSPHSCLNCKLLIDFGELLGKLVELGQVAAVAVPGHLEEVSHPQGRGVIRQRAFCDLQESEYFTDVFPLPNLTKELLTEIGFQNSAKHLKCKMAQTSGD